MSGRAPEVAAPARSGPFFLAAGGGVLYALGFAGYGLWPLAFVALAPLWQALEATRAERWPRAALLGLAFGAAAHAVGFPWLWRLVGVFLGGDARLGAALWLAHAVWFALGFALQALLYRAARARGWPVACAGVAPLVAVEWLQPALFPGHLGSALLELGPWIQIADLGGPLLASALVALVNAACLESWRWLRGARPRPVATWLAAGLAAALAGGYGAARVGALARALEAAPALRVGLVQANLGALEKRRDPAEVHRLHLAQTQELLAGGPVDLVIWPETVYSRGLQGPLPISGLLIRGELRTPLLFGAASVRAEGGQRRRFNAALLIAADGVIRDGYEKNLLVPFAERVPLAELAPFLVPLFPHAQEFGAGSDTPPLALGPWRISTPICSESLHPAFVRRMVARARPHLLVSLANDGWFGDSAAPWLHLAAARLRAVEERRYLVHATNSGVSAVIDPAGRVVARSGLLTRENLVADVRMLDADTVYARLGDWPGWLAAALALPLPRSGRKEGVAEHVVGDAPALGDALGLVERPVDAEVDAALAVLLLGLRERAEAAREQRPHVALVVERHAVELVGHEGERDVVGAVEVAQRLEQRAAEAGVARGIGREGRREVRAGRGCWPARRAAMKVGSPMVSGLPSPSAGRAGARVGLADAGDRAARTRSSTSTPRSRCRRRPSRR